VINLNVNCNAWVSFITSWLTLLFGCCGHKPVSGCVLSHELPLSGSESSNFTGTLEAPLAPHVLLWLPVLSSLNLTFYDETETLLAFHKMHFMFAHPSLV
jgi:hypothetical protein